MESKSDNKGLAILLKSSFWYLFSTILLNGINFIVTPIFTRIMSTNEYGIYNNYCSWQSIFAVFVTLNLGVTLMSAYGDYKSDIKRYSYSMTVLMCLSTLLWLVLFTLFRKPLMSWTTLEMKYLYMILASSIGASILSMFQSYQRMEFRYKTSTAISIIIALANTGLALALVLSMKGKAFGRIIGTTLPTFLFGLVLFFYFAKGAHGIKTSYWKYAVPLALPYVPHSLSMTLLNSMDKTMITKMCGNEKTAIYSVAYTCGSIVIVVLMAINTAYSPWLREKVEQDAHAKVRKFSYLYVGIGVSICLMVILFAPEIILLFGGSKYKDSVYVLPPIAMGCMLQFLYTMFVNIEQIQKHTVEMAFASATAALVNLGLNFLLIPRFGYLAAAYTTLVGYLVLLLIHMHVVKKIKMDHYYNYKFIYGLVVVMVTFSIFANTIYGNIFVRVGVILALLIAICVVAYKVKAVEKVKALIAKRK
ncbi:lipopolysaccharide biosynthesis protein [Pseudobutyrivibrio sp. YE44]|uniref:lipopolysaccharide biosynthesis protein n=1 Tax=Pseudobutyrivibrio sp. YE44 TaxID=1520802 RepID=UPI0015A1D719|nr:oligosaccharide flippase family protein [Pseudobutyrivibrio sp. YE44]